MTERQNFACHDTLPPRARAVASSAPPPRGGRSRAEDGPAGNTIASSGETHAASSLPHAEGWSFFSRHSITAAGSVVRTDGWDRSLGASSLQTSGSGAIAPSCTVADREGGGSLRPGRSLLSARPTLGYSADILAGGPSPRIPTTPDAVSLPRHFREVRILPILPSRECARRSAK